MTREEKIQNVLRAKTPREFVENIEKLNPSEYAEYRLRNYYGKVACKGLTEQDFLELEPLVDLEESNEIISKKEMMQFKKELESEGIIIQEKKSN